MDEWVGKLMEMGHWFMGHLSTGTIEIMLKMFEPWCSLCVRVHCLCIRPASGWVDTSSHCRGIADGASGWRGYLNLDRHTP